MIRVLLVVLVATIGAVVAYGDPGRIAKASGKRLRVLPLDLSSLAS